jgi:hypothetical protein
MRAQRIALGLMLAIWAGLGGCATVAPSPERLLSTETSYSAGRAVQDFALSSSKVGEALTEAMEDLKMSAIEPGRDGAVYKIQAKTSDNRLVMVTLRPHQGQTRVGCRIGWFGDEPLSKAIMERVGIRLELLPPAPIPDDPPSSPAPNPFLLRDSAVKDGMLRDMVDAPYRDRVIPP